MKVESLLTLDPAPRYDGKLWFNTPFLLFEFGNDSNHNEYWLINLWSAVTLQWSTIISLKTDILTSAVTDDFPTQTWRCDLMLMLRWTHLWILWSLLHPWRLLVQTEDNVRGGLHCDDFSKAKTARVEVKNTQNAKEGNRLKGLTRLLCSVICVGSLWYHSLRWKHWRYDWVQRYTTLILYYWYFSTISGWVTFYYQLTEAPWVPQNGAIFIC